MLGRTVRTQAKHTRTKAKSNLYEEQHTPTKSATAAETPEAEAQPATTGKAKRSTAEGGPGKGKGKRARRAGATHQVPAKVYAYYSPDPNGRRNP